MWAKSSVSPTFLLCKNVNLCLQLVKQLGAIRGSQHHTTFYVVLWQSDRITSSDNAHPYRVARHTLIQGFVVHLNSYNFNRWLLRLKSYQICLCVNLHHSLIYTTGDDHWFFIFTNLIDVLNGHEKRFVCVTWWVRNSLITLLHKFDYLSFLCRITFQCLQGWTTKNWSLLGRKLILFQLLTYLQLDNISHIVIYHVRLINEANKCR